MPKKKFSVDIQHTEEFTYQVEADNEDAACEEAMRLYRNGETASHEDIVSNGSITNCEEITNG